MSDVITPPPDDDNGSDRLPLGAVDMMNARLRALRYACLLFSGRTSGTPPDPDVVTFYAKLFMQFVETGQ